MIKNISLIGENKPYQAPLIIKKPNIIAKSNISQNDVLNFLTYKNLVSFGSVDNSNDLISQINIKNLQNHIKFLSSDKCAGRYPGTKGHKIAQDYIIKEFNKYGLQDFKPISQDYKNNHSFKTYFRLKNDEHNLDNLNFLNSIYISNAVGYIPAKSDEYLFVTAHYDHLGRDIDSGEIFSGAEDNAAGVAVMLEIARIMAKQNPKKNIVFVATDGEEQSFLGANGLIKDLKKNKILNAKFINIDCPGMSGNSLTIEGNTLFSKEFIKTAKNLNIKYDFNNFNAATDGECFNKSFPTIDLIWNKDGKHNEIHSINDKESFINYQNVVNTIKVALVSTYDLTKNHKTTKQNCSEQ